MQTSALVVDDFALSHNLPVHPAQKYKKKTMRTTSSEKGNALI